jgi:hypothetical protein
VTPRTPCVFAAERVDEKRDREDVFLPLQSLSVLHVPSGLLEQFFPGSVAMTFASSNVTKGSTALA